MISIHGNVLAAEAAADMQQVWLNCAAYNEDGSEMFEAGRAAEAELAALCVAAGLPTPGDAAARGRRSGSKRVSPQLLLPCQQWSSRGT